MNHTVTSSPLDSDMHNMKIQLWEDMGLGDRNEMCSGWPCTQVHSKLCEVITGLIIEFHRAIGSNEG